MLFPVEILLLIIVAKTYYFYMDTVNGTKNLRYLEITKSRDLILASVVSLSVFGNTLRSEVISVIHLENSFVISTAIFPIERQLFSVANFQKARVTLFFTGIAFLNRVSLFANKVQVYSIFKVRSGHSEVLFPSNFMSTRIARNISAPKCSSFVCPNSSTIDIQNCTNLC